MRAIRIGSGAGYSGDRIEPALELLERGAIQYIVFECLAERTIALAQLRRARNPDHGYDELLAHRLRHALPLCAAKGVKLITNMGAANPRAALQEAARVASSLGLHGLKLASVLGDDIFPQIARYQTAPLLEIGAPLGALGDAPVSANAYLGAQGIVTALRGGADVVITGRVADPALVLAPLLFEFGWDMTDYSLLGKGTLAGHLIECGAQVTGGYFSDPGYKDVPDLANLGFPVVEVTERGDVTVTRLAGVGGYVTPATVKEQILYEIHDPSRYLTPDVTADFSQTRVTVRAPNQVRVNGASGTEPNGQYKTTIGYRDGFIVEGEMSYGGSGAYDRARLAAEVVRQRLVSASDLALDLTHDLRAEVIGVNALYGDTLAQRVSPTWRSPVEARLRVAARTTTREAAARIGAEVEALYTNGPAGGGGARVALSEALAVASILIPARDVTVDVIYAGG